MGNTDVNIRLITIGDLDELRTELEIVAERMEDLYRAIDELREMQRQQENVTAFWADPAKALRTIRVKAGVKQKDLAKTLNVTPNYLSLIEHGKREPSLSFIRGFFKEMGI